jgi:cell division protein FtsW
MAVTSLPQQGARSAAPDERRLSPAWNFDAWLALVAGALLVFGLLVVYSTTFPWSLYSTGDTTTVFMRQVSWLGLGLVVVAISLRFDYRVLRSLSVPIMGVTVLLLVLVLVVGTVIFGARRGLVNGSFQPGELAKLATIIYLAHWLSSKGDRLRSVKLGLAPFGVVVGVVAGLIFMQPDLSTALLIVLTAGTMFFLAGADLRQLLVGLVAAALAFWLLVPRLPYAQDRIAEWRQALDNPAQATWHTRQALIAIGSGGPAGLGFGTSRQKFGILPTPHTDSVFAIIGEELGLVGTLAVLGLFGFLVQRGFKVAQQSQDEFGYILAVGITCSLGYEALINMMVMTGIFPFTGVALPFMSYGGSSLLVAMLSVGILLNISRGALSQRLRRRRAYSDGGRGDGGSRLPGTRGR